MRENTEKITDLADLRREIDRIDAELVTLFSKRMEVSSSVASYKKATGMAVTDPVREAALLDRVSALSPAETADYTRTLYSNILSLSRAYQHVKLGTDSPLSAEIKATQNSTPPALPDTATVACQGREGAYSFKAAKSLFSHPVISRFDHFADVFTAIERGECRYGILPIENSTAGSVTEIYDLMSRHRFYIVGAIRLSIDHCLLATPGTSLSDVKEIVSHPQALAQCSAFLAAHPHIKVTPMENTATAAGHAATVGGGVAAIADQSCAPLYGLSVITDNIRDCSNNQTRFICISKTPEIYPGADKTSVMLTLPHRPGVLSKLLTRFDAMQINLSKLESRPIPERDFEFRFYFDLLCPAKEEKLLHLLSELAGESEAFRYLGTYKEICCHE